MRNLLLFRVHPKNRGANRRLVVGTDFASVPCKYGVNRRKIQVRIPRMSEFAEISVTLPDGYDAYARFWQAKEPVGAVLYHHGIQSHCGWYEASARSMVQAGFSVLQVDRRGSGRNEIERGHADSTDQLIDDALAARDELVRRSGFENHHVVGVSWGGKLAVAAYITDPTGVRSLSLVTPGLFPQVGASKKMMQEIGFAMLYEPQRRFDIPLNEPELFTDDPTWRTFFQEDPQTLRECSAGFYLASRRMDKTVSKLGAMPPIPIHLILVDREHIIINEKTEEYVRDLGWSVAKTTYYENSLHSIEFEQSNQTFFGDLVRFISESNT